MLRRSIVLLAALVAVLAFCVLAMAHDGEINWTFTSLTPYSVEHNDDEPFKGWVLANVYNDTDEAWTDFHFEIFSIGFSVANVDFIDYAPYQPTSSVSSFTYVINNAPATGATFDFYFAANPILPGQSAWFKVYTDNTTDKKRFGVMIYPTVPEPASVVAMAGSLLGLAGMIRRRKI